MSATCTLSSRERYITIAAVPRATAANHATHLIDRGFATWVRRTLTSTRAEAVTHSGLGHDERGPNWILLDLPPQVGDMNPQVSLCVTRGPTPHRAENLLVGKRTTRAAHEGAE